MRNRRLLIRKSVIGGPFAEVFTAAVSASARDASQVISTGAVSTNGVLLRLDSDRINGIAFLNVTIPQGATIIEAKLTLQAAESDATAPVARLRCEAADNAGVYTTGANNVGGRSYTTAETLWTLAALVSGEDQTSPDFSEAVQEVIDRAGWASGNALAVGFDHSSGAGQVDFASFDNVTFTEPRIRITYVS